MKALQTFSDEYLERCKEMSVEEIVEFIEGFRELHYREPDKSKLISMKVPENLLNAFKTKAKLQGIPYQTMIKKLMMEWLEN